MFIHFLPNFHFVLVISPELIPILSPLLTISSKMGKIWGNLFYIKNIAYYRVSPYELNPFASKYRE